MLSLLSKTITILEVIIFAFLLFIGLISVMDNDYIPIVIYIIIGIINHYTAKAMRKKLKEIIRDKEIEEDARKWEY